MPKVYPNANTATVTKQQQQQQQQQQQRRIGDDQKLQAEVEVLTVWKKSLLFNCNGFTVYDSKGNLFYRVDNYNSSAGSKAEILLMNAKGDALLTLRRKRLFDNWMVFEGESDVDPKFNVKKKNQVNFLNSKSLAQVIGCNNKKMYDIEGSYLNRSCTVYDENKRVVAEIKRKEAQGGGAICFGGDVFRLVVQPDLDPTVAMAFVILLDQMYGSSKWSKN